MLRRTTDRRFGGLALPTIIMTTLLGALIPFGATSASANALNEVTDSTSPTISYTGSWRSTASPSDLGGSIQFLHSSGSADLKFTGTSVSWTSRLTASSGKSAVYIDGVLAKIVDGYSSTTRYAQTAFTSAVLPRGEHTISVRHTGTRNAASTGSNVIIDGFAVTDSQDAVAAPTVINTLEAYRYAGCPAATVTVTNASTLAAEVSKATPGTVIRMAPGTYSRVSLKANGTSDKPIWLCGPRNAIVSAGSTQSNHGITVSDSSHFIVAGMTVTNGQKGITVRRSHHVTVADALVHTVGHEAVHFRENTTDSVVIGNTIRNTGLIHGPYGEGVYIGSSDRNWCSLTACLPDRSDRNSVINNTISRTTAQSIEAKEGTTGGVIRGNVFDGLGMTNADSWVMVKGNDWKITSNTGTNGPQHGFEVNGSVAGWSYRNLFANNSAKVDASGFGFKVYEPNGKGTSGTILSCTNTVTGAASGFAVAACTP